MLPIYLKIDLKCSFKIQCFYLLGVLTFVYDNLFKQYVAYLRHLTAKNEKCLLFYFNLLWKNSDILCVKSLKL